MPKWFPTAAFSGGPACVLPARGQGAAAQLLESRSLLSVSLDADGWTVVTPPKDARVIYVSSSGGDNHNSGTSPNSPLKSVTAGAALLRDGSGDQLLLKAGDEWHESLGTWAKSGRSADEPLVVGTYGDGPRPLLMTGAGMGFNTRAGAEVSHVAVLGIDFYADARDPDSPTFRTTENVPGVQLMARGEDLLFEDCAVRSYGTNIVIQTPSGPLRDATFRRSAILDAYCPSAHSEGIYAEGVQNLTLEENVFDHNGWNAKIPGGVATIFNHDAYLTNTTDGVVVRGNVFANAASHGLQARGGGDIEDNVFLNDPLGLSFGLVRGSPVKAGGVDGIVNGNVFLGTRDINGAGRGIGLEVANTRPGAATHVSNNIFSTDTDIGPEGNRAAAGGGFPAIMLEYGSDLTNPGEAVGLNDLKVTANIVYRWSAGLSVQDGVQPGGSGNQALNRVSLGGNDFQRVRNAPIIRQDGPLDSSQEHWSGGRYDAAGSESGWVSIDHRNTSLDRWNDATGADGKAVRVPYAAPDRSAADYSESLGGPATTAGFLAVARTQSHADWRPEYTAAGLVAYVRDGFNEPGVAPRDWRAPTPPAAAVALPTSITTAATALTFTVTYTDDKAVDVASISTASVHVAGPNGSDRAAFLVSVVGGEGEPVVATYSLSSPAPVWRRTDAGSYAVLIDANGVKDADGFAVPAGRIGKAKIEVVKVPPPPAVKKVKFTGGATKAVTVAFTADVSASVDAGDLVLTAEDGTPIDPALTAVTWDAKHTAAVWTFPGLPNGVLPAGVYHATLKAAGVGDADGRLLDGNKDGLGGDDFVSVKAYKSKG